MQTCAITGHRPTRFKFKYKENQTGCKRLKKRLQEQFIELYEKGVHRFLIGGALGVDIWSGEILLKLKEQTEFSDLQMVVVIPFEGHDNAWEDRSRKRLMYLKEHAETITLEGITDAEGYKRRNRYMIDHADCVIAVYDNNRSIRSGTGYTVHYALKKKIPVTYIHPDTGKVTHSWDSTEK